MGKAKGQKTEGKEEATGGELYISDGFYYGRGTGDVHAQFPVSQLA